MENNNALGLAFWVIQFDRKLTNLNFDYLIIGYDYSIAEVVYREHLSSSNKITSLDKIWEFIDNYKENYEQITNLEIETLGKSVLLLECRFISLENLSQYYLEDRDSFIDKTEEIYLEKIDPSKRGILMFKGFKILPFLPKTPSKYYPSGWSRYSHSKIKFNQLPQSCKKILISIIKDSTDNKLRYITSDIINNTNFNNYIN